MATSIHKLAFEGDHGGLKDLLDAKKPEEVSTLLESVDKHGCTPLLLATMKNQRKAVQVLMEHGADLGNKGDRIWPPIAEAISVGDRETIKDIYLGHDKLIKSKVQEKTEQFLVALEAADDCYLEMDWDVHSWVPLVSRVLPSDHVKIWKKGRNIRIDSTMLDIANHGITRGERTYLITQEQSGSLALTVIEYAEKKYFKQVLFDSKGKELDEEVLEDDITQLMFSEITDGDFSPDDIEFEKALSGWPGFRTDRIETIGDYEANVYNVKGFEFKTITRQEHLTKEDMKRMQKMKRDAANGADVEKLPFKASLSPPRRAVEDWNTYSRSPEYIHPGRPIDAVHKSRAFKPSVWMTESKEFPLRLESVVSLFSALAKTSEQIQRVRDFIGRQLPPGFPIKFDLPVFPTVSVRVSFCKVTLGVNGGDEIFKVPEGYELMEEIMLVEENNGNEGETQDSTKLLCEDDDGDKEPQDSTA
eukprot:m.286948 g.286948  ORF g.286948 m.286948 type:complete len:474 (+) comp16356_c1_seq3:154-1575(+)